MALNRKQIGNVYRPQGPKALVLGTPWTSGGKALISGPQIDLSNPIEGFRLVFTLRDVIAVATMTTPSPLGYFNLIKRILITGKNTRAGGNVTLWDIDLASLALIQTAFKKKPFIYNGVSAAGAASAGTEAASDAMGTPVLGLFNGTAGTYDIRIVVDIPAYPFHCLEVLRPGFAIRSQEWGDSLQIRLEFGTVTNGADGALGLDAGTTTHTFTAKGSGAGSPSIDLYALPTIAGIDVDAQLTPGFLSRITVPVTALLQAAGGANTKLLTMEKTNTVRMFAIVGTSTTNPTMLSLSDTNLSTLAMVVGGNRIVRENDDIWAHKMDQVRRYGTQPIQGLTLFDFMAGGNPDSAYNASDAGGGTTLEIRGTVAGVANAQGIFVQESEQYRPEGGLYSA